MQQTAIYFQCNHNFFSNENINQQYSSETRILRWTQKANNTNNNNVCTISIG